ncbi:Uncharacterized protein APZ42_005033 [Daphnia magna]|uniref:Uncharacterized protein n=1 Tax=Daphnia magna TaxID=35525 RepID=A0A162EZF6_9CRUS|nr:Uncharacterized protein APZ42_005033 [Daphnia magna]
MVYIVPMQKDIEGMVDTNYNTEMIPCNDCGRNIARVKLLSHKVNNCFDETRPSFDGVKTILQPKVSMTSQESHKKFVSQENSMEIEAFVDSNAVEMSPQSNVNITDDKSAPSEKQHVPAAVNSIIHASSHLPYGRHVHSYRSRSSTSSMRSYETSGSSTTSKSKYRPKSNRSTSRSICHVDRSTRHRETAALVLIRIKIPQRATPETPQDGDRQVLIVCSATPSKSSRSPQEKEFEITSMPPNYTAKKISSQEELLEYMKEVGGTIVLGKDIESMFPPSSEVLKIDIIEEPKDLKTILPSCDVEVPKNAVNDDLFLPVNGEYPNFQTVSQYLEEFLEEKQKQIDAAFAEDEDEEIDLQQLEMKIWEPK